MFSNTEEFIMALPETYAASNGRSLLSVSIADEARFNSSSGLSYISIENIENRFNNIEELLDHVIGHLSLMVEIHERLVSQ